MASQKDEVVKQCHQRMKILIDLMNQSKEHCFYFCCLFIPIGFVVCAMYFTSILIGYIAGLCIVYLLSGYMCRFVLNLPNWLITPMAIIMIAFSWRQKLLFDPNYETYGTLYDKVLSTKQDDKPSSNAIIDSMIVEYIKSLL
jgi:energy-coupling factor transporter transmembrane protein EcfT